MDTLRRGAISSQVRLLQRLLSKVGRRDRLGFAPLVEDGNFGSTTETAVRAFQASRHITRHPGECDGGTWALLGLTIEIEHPVTLMGQPSGTSCWAAAAAMIAGNYTPSIGGDHIAPGGGLAGEVEHNRAFAESLGWTMPLQTPNTDDLIGFMRRGPVWARCGGPNWAHAVVFSAIHSDGSANCTLLRIHDPWPPGSGRVYGTFLDRLHSYDTAGTEVSMSLEYLLIPR